MKFNISRRAIRRSGVRFGWCGSSFGRDCFSVFFFADGDQSAGRRVRPSLAVLRRGKHANTTGKEPLITVRVLVLMKFLLLLSLRRLYVYFTISAFRVVLVFFAK